jgi:hypothetical protein
VFPGRDPGLASFSELIRQYRRLRSSRTSGWSAFGRGQELQQARFDLACPGLPALAIEPRELRVTGALKNSQLVEIPGAAHVQSFRYECTRTMKRDFYNTPGQKADVSCLKSIPPLRFVTDVKAISR